MKVHVCALALVAAALAAPAAFAGTISHSGPQVGPGGADGWEGTSVWYLNVEETNTEGPAGVAVPLFGAPSVQGDSIDFSPTIFSAQSQGADTESTEGEVAFMVVAKPGQVIESLNYSEAGDTTLAGVPSTDETWSSVSADVTVEVLEVDGAPLPMPVVVTQQLTYLPSGGDFHLSSDSGGGFLYQTTWVGELMLDLVDVLDGANVAYSAGATKVNVLVSNLLTATSIDGTSAFIKKKDFDGVSITANVPEPTAALLASLAALVAPARRRVA